MALVVGLSNDVGDNEIAIELFKVNRSTLIAIHEHEARILHNLRQLPGHDNAPEEV